MSLGQNITKGKIEKLIPHAGNMVLVDEICDWNSDSITATVFEHSLSSSPLIEPEDNDQFNSILLIEYSAQVAAIHAGLVASGLGERRPAYIGAVKNIDIQQKCVLPISNITINAIMLLSSANGAIYQMECRQGQTVIISAKLILSQP